MYRSRGPAGCVAGLICSKLAEKHHSKKYANRAAPHSHAPPSGLKGNYCCERKAILVIEMKLIRNKSSLKHLLTVNVLSSLEDVCHTVTVMHVKESSASHQAGAIIACGEIKKLDLYL